MFYVKYNVEKQLMTYANAGHNHPYLFRPRDGFCTELDADGLILGVRRDVVFEEKIIQLQKGDILLLYTDGITEASNPSGEFFGTERLCSIMGKMKNEPPEGIVDIILKHVNEFTGLQAAMDDISMIVMKVI
jgi:sigma-B regulation protein RsbU (phosphoserine phosphatase)